MILSGQTIRRLDIITPFHERTVTNGMSYGLGPASYDVRIAEDVTIKPGESVLVHTIEKFAMPADVLGRVSPKSSWARMFLATPAVVIDPGFHGHMTVALTNLGRAEIHIEEGAPIVQVVFELLDEPAEKPYAGRYNNAPARPVATILEAA